MTRTEIHARAEQRRAAAATQRYARAMTRYDRPGAVRVYSRTAPGVFYVVHLERAECDCPAFARGHRACWHLAEAREYDRIMSDVW